MSKAQAIRDQIEANKVALRTWLETAKAHGTIYYNIEKVGSGMIPTRYYSLWTIDGPELVMLWPAYSSSSEGFWPAAKAMGFGRHRTLGHQGGGDELVYGLAQYAGLDAGEHMQGIYLASLTRYE